jgi:hypothetical protein
MSHPERPSRWRSPGAEGAGRIPLTALIALGASLAAAGGVLGLRSGRGAAPLELVAVAKGGGSRSMGMGVPERSYIASVSRDGSLQSLTGDFDSASTPSVSLDGSRFLFAGRRTASEAPAVWERRIDGSHLRKVTEGNGDPGGPIEMPDGRILFSDRPARSAAGEARSLFSCAADGSDVRRLTFSSQQDLRPRLLPDGRVAFERTILEPERGGAPVKMYIHPDGTGLAVLPDPGTERVPLDGVGNVKAPRGDYLVASVRTAARTAPPILTSVVRPDWKTGTLLCLNVYDSRIPAVAALPPGSVRKVRVTTRNEAGDELAGEAPVMSDGSFFVEVPADTPLEIHLMGEEGAALASFRTGIWVRPNENHACLGCHEKPETAPENRQPLAVQRPATSLLLALTKKGGSGGR